ncbi:SMI1/KNR4 family protein [Photobacterium alginatilyticum]|uniref:SMI1/KNR4 family protein n=1 Tax=Photobacterium alginatilyticum TaxID=1775171 RepID=A0ABW9YU70_9GAMM|nr:SMI1/KNR4 family protein [Photobacterium alginatilyticum]NBI56074.1 SMI1/KNR4 family protein [Photobacterium alginatilyticum]
MKQHQGSFKWISLVEQHTDDFEFSEPATLSEIVEAEKELDLIFPTALKECLLESNGVFGEYGLGLVWTLRAITETNTEFRQNNDFSELYMPFDSLLFFGDAGNGDQFAFPIQAGVIRRDDVFVWNHEDDSRSWVAPSLEKYIEWQLNGKICT